MYDFDTGDIVAGKYEIKKVLGIGGMGKVYRARQVDLGRDVALKVPSQAVLQSPEVMARFSREAKTVAKLSHDNIVQVYEYFHEGDLAFIAMEFVEGEDLKAFTTKGAADLTVGDLGKILELACEGMGHAHDHGIVHRDIKPHNIMVARLPRGRWRVKVMDFGIAHIDASAQFAEMTNQLTQTGQALGTPTYMSPEQIRGANVSHLSDLYSFGCVIYYVFTQSTVFSGSGLTVAVSHLNEHPPSIRSKIPGLPPEFDELIMKCLEKDPAKRPQHASEIGSRILKALEPIKDMPLSEIWKSGPGSGDAVIPLMGAANTLAGGEQLVEVQTQNTLAHTDPFEKDSEINSAKTVMANTLSESPTQTTPPGGWDPESKTMVMTPSAITKKPDVGGPKRPVDTPAAPPATPAEGAPAAKKPARNMMLIAAVALACLVLGVFAAVAISRQKDGDGQVAAGGNERTPAPDEPDIMGTPEPLPTDPAATPQPTPRGTTPPPATPTARPTASPTPSPTPDLDAMQLANLRNRAADARDFATRIEYYAKIMELYNPQRPEFSEEVLTAADNVARRVTLEPAMVDIVGGVFSMGNDQGYEDEKPVHQPRLSPYRIGKYEVTALEFATFLNANADVASVLYKPDGSTNIYYDETLKRYRPVEGRELHPANKVSWNAANEYAAWLSTQTGRLYRLPTEAEWERAARGNPPAPYPWGNNQPSRAIANYANASGTVPVNSMPEGSSYDGSLHMAGNVAEWVLDWFDDNYYAQSPTVDPRGPDKSSERTARRVYRGGSYLVSKEEDLISSRRSREKPEAQLPDLGFRLAEEL